LPSRSLQRWQTESSAALDQIENAHAAVGGNLRGRRYATLQINHAYLVMVSSHFQRFCRDLHTEAIDHLCAQSVPPDPRRDILRMALTLSRQLDSKNPSPGAIGSDFNRFNIRFWDVVKRHAPALNERRQTLLEDLNKWRNAIAHQDFIAAGLDPARLSLSNVNRFRTACNNLAQRFDVILGHHLATISGVRPW